MLETLGEPDVRKMSMEEPEKMESGWFEMPELNSDDHNVISSRIQEARLNPILAFKFIRNAIELGILETLPVTEIQGLEKNVKIQRTASNFYELSNVASELKLAGIDPQLTSEDMEGMLQFLREHATHGLPQTFRIVAKNIKVLGGDPKLTDAEVKHMTSVLESEREVPLWNNFTRVARQIRELGLDVKIGPEEITGMEGYLRTFLQELRDKKSNNWGKFVSMAADMKYLSDPPSNPNSKISVPGQQPPEQRNF